jgi:hypothetical protein
MLAAVLGNRSNLDKATAAGDLCGQVSSIYGAAMRAEYRGVTCSGCLPNLKVHGGVRFAGVSMVTCTKALDEAPPPKESIGKGPGQPRRRRQKRG